MDEFTTTPPVYKGFIIVQMPIMATMKFVALNPDGTPSGMATLSMRGTREAIDTYHRQIELEDMLAAKAVAVEPVTDNRPAAQKLGRRDINEGLM